MWYYHTFQIAYCAGPYTPHTGTPSALATHRPRKSCSSSTYWLSTNFCSLEIVCSHRARRVTVMALRKWHFVVYWARHFGQPLREFEAGVCWLAFCEFYLTCRISVYYVRNKAFLFNVISDSHFRLVHGGRCVVYYMAGVAGTWSTFYRPWCTAM